MIVTALSNQKNRCVMWVQIVVHRVEASNGNPFSTILLRKKIIDQHCNSDTTKEDISMIPLEINDYLTENKG